MSNPIYDTIQSWLDSVNYSIPDPSQREVGPQDAPPYRPNAFSPEPTPTVLSESAMWKALNPAMSQYGTGSFGPSMLDQYRNAQAGLDKLKGLNVSDASRKTAESVLGSQKLQAGVGMGLSVLNGVTGLVNGFNSASQISDTSAQQGQINNINQIGTQNYSNFGSLASGYDALGRQPKIDYDEIRGMSTGQQAGSVLSSVGTGASAGMAFGPYGALVGGIIGLGTGIAGVLNGNANARNEQVRLQREAKQATNNATINLNAASERLQNNEFRSGIANRAAQGGQIERRQLTAREFADKVLKARRNNDVTRSACIVSRKGKGGTIVRIKM